MDKKTVKRLLSYCQPYLHFIIFLMVLSIISVVLTLIVPVLLGQAIDVLIGKNQVNLSSLTQKLIFIAAIILVC